MWQLTKYQCLRGGKIYRVPPGTVKKQLPKGQTVTIPVFSARFYHVGGRRKPLAVFLPI